MTPSSDTLEKLYERLRAVDSELARHGGAEIKPGDLTAKLGILSKEWLGYSEALRRIEAVPREILDPLDDAMRAVLQATKLRTRASSHRKKLAPMLSGFLDSVVVPVIRHEGSPAQVAGRQIAAEFSGRLDSDEMAYVDEASKCLAAKCHRAAIIMLWAAGVARLHRGIEKFGFNAFNTALQATLQKKGFPFNRVANNPVNSLPELQRTRDFDLIAVGMDLWKYDLQVFEELERLLGTRNSAAHPGMVQPTALDVQQFASKLSAYLFAKVPL